MPDFRYRFVDASGQAGPWRTSHTQASLEEFHAHLRTDWDKPKDGHIEIGCPNEDYVSNCLQEAAA